MRENDLKQQCRLIFAEALRAVEAGASVRKAVKFSGKSQLHIVDKTFQITNQTSLYAVAVGKAAYPMAFALDEILGDQITAGLISGVLPDHTANPDRTDYRRTILPKWEIFTGGHPLPNQASLAAAKSCLKLLETANSEAAIVIFLISGGGSAMFELPIDDSISLADLRQANKILVSCGASISEINRIRRAFSRVKGGGLARFAPRAAQITLIISDTESGDERSVASGMTFDEENIDFEEIERILETYSLMDKLPASIIQNLGRKNSNKNTPTENLRRHFVLLDNLTAISATAEFAAANSLTVEIAQNISEQNVETGCGEILNRMSKILAEIKSGEIACLISGGEFSCAVRGDGIGGRNAETVLQMALMLDKNMNEFAEIAFLSAGTDGIDGNSPAAGAVCDLMTLKRAKDLNLDARKFLENSDSHSFFQLLGDAVVTNPTGTNVRDLRIMLARK